MSASRRLVVRLGLATVVVIVAGTYATFYRAYGQAASDLPAQLALAKQEGLPVTLDELVAGMRVSDAENAGPDYKALFPIILSPGSVRDAFRPFDGFSEKDPDNDAKRAALPALTAVLEQARQISAKPRCDFNRDYRKGFALALPEFSYLRRIVRALCFESETRSREGNWAGALEDLKAAQKIGRHLGDEPIEMGVLIQLSTEVLVQRSFERVIADHAQNAAFLAEAKRVEDGFGPLPDFRRTIGTNLVITSAALKDPETLKLLQETPGSESFKDPLAQFRFNISTVRDAYADKAVTRYRQLYAATSSRLEDWEANRAAMATVYQQVRQDHSPSNALGPLFFDISDLLGDVPGEAIAFRNVIGTELHLLIDGQKTGKLANKLPDNDPSSLDPFTHKPLIYHPSVKGFVLYSVGKDRKDNGGKGQIKDIEDKPGFDIVAKINE